MEAREHYMKEAKAVVNDVVDSAKRAARRLRRIQEEVRVLVVGGGGREHALCWHCVATPPLPFPTT